MKQGNAWLVSLALGATLAVGCGLVEEPHKVAHDAGASRSVEDASHDGGPDAAIATDDALAAEAGPKLSPCQANTVCAEPPHSVCIDDATLRWYWSSCEDGCQLHTSDMKCLPSDLKPDCFAGGCRAVLVR